MIAELRARQGSLKSLFYTLSKEFLEAGKTHLTGEYDDSAHFRIPSGATQKHLALRELLSTRFSIIRSTIEVPHIHLVQTNSVKEAFHFFLKFVLFGIN